MSPRPCGETRRGRQGSGEPAFERLHGRGAGQEVRHGRHGVQAPGREALPVSGDGPLQPEDRRLQHIAASRLRADPREDGERVRRTGREGERSPVPQRPGLAVPEEGVRGHPEGIRQDPDDVAEGELPRQLGNGELLWGLKAEMFYGQEDRYGDYGSLKKAIVEYINWYNSSRLKEYLHWKSPQEALSNSGTL